MKKDKKKKKKPVGGTKSELNGTGESMADSVSSEGGGAEGGVDGGGEEVETKLPGDKEGDQRIMNENDEGGSKAEEAEDAEKSKIKGLEMSTGKKIENLPKAGVFNEEDWEFGKDSKVEGENPEQELVGGVTSRIKLFETVEAPKAQRVFKKPLRVLKRQESEEEKRNQKLMGEAFKIGPGRVSTLGELHKGPSRQQADKIDELQEDQSDSQPRVATKSLAKGGKGGNPLEAEGEARDGDQAKLGELHKGPSNSTMGKGEKNLTQGGRGGSPLEAECVDKDKEDNQAKNEARISNKQKSVLQKEGGGDKGRQKVTKPKGAGKLETVEEEGTEQNDTEKAFAELLNDTGDENGNPGTKSRGLINKTGVVEGVADTAMGKPINRSTPKKPGAGQGVNITEQEINERGLPRQLSTTGLTRNEAEARGGIYDEQGELQGLRDDQALWALEEDDNEPESTLERIRDDVGSWAKEVTSNYQPEVPIDWEKEKEIMREKFGYNKATMAKDGVWKGDAGKLWQEGQGEPGNGRRNGTAARWKDETQIMCYRCGRMGHQSRKCEFSRHVRGYPLNWGEGDCYHCGGQHNVVRCMKIRGACYGCGKRDHTKEICPSKDEIDWEERIPGSRMPENVNNAFQTRVQNPRRMEGGEGGARPENAEDNPERVRIQTGRNRNRMSYSQAVRAEGEAGLKGGGGLGQEQQEEGQVVAYNEDGHDERIQENVLSPRVQEGGEGEGEGILQVRPSNRNWDGNQYQRLNQQGETNRFDAVFKSIPKDKINLEDAIKEFFEDKDGKVRLRAEVTRTTGRLESAAIAADVASIVELPISKVREVINMGEGVVMVGVDSEATQDIKELVEGARSGRPMVGSRTTLRNIRVEQTRDPKERDKAERTMVFLAVPMSPDTGTYQRAYCMAMESDQGKQLFERDPNSPNQVQLLIGRNNFTKNGKVVGEAVYNGQIECQVLPEVDLEDVKKAMGGGETPFSVDLGGVLTERTLGGKHGCRTCNRVWCKNGGGMNCFKVLGKRVTKKEREEDAKRDRERLNVKDNQPRRALWGRVEKVEEPPVKSLKVLNILVAKHTSHKNGIEEAKDSMIYQMYEAYMLKLGKDSELKAASPDAPRDQKVARMRNLGKDPRASAWMKNVKMQVRTQEEGAIDEEKSKKSYKVQVKMEAKEKSVELAASEEMLLAQSLVRTLRRGHDAWKDSVMEVTKLEMEESTAEEKLKQAFSDTVNLTMESKKTWETQAAAKVKVECKLCPEVMEVRDVRDHLLTSHRLEPTKVKYKFGEIIDGNMAKIREEGILEEELEGDILEALTHYKVHNGKKKERKERKEGKEGQNSKKNETVENGLAKGGNGGNPVEAGGKLIEPEEEEIMDEEVSDGKLLDSSEDYMEGGGGGNLSETGHEIREQNDSQERVGQAKEGENGGNSVEADQSKVPLETRQADNKLDGDGNAKEGESGGNSVEANQSKSSRKQGKEEKEGNASEVTFSHEKEEEKKEEEEDNQQWVEDYTVNERNEVEKDKEFHTDFVHEVTAGIANSETDNEFRPLEEKVLATSKPHFGYRDSFTVRDYATAGTREGKVESTGIWGATATASDRAYKTGKKYKIHYLSGAWATAVMKSSREGTVTLSTGEEKPSWACRSWQRFMEDQNPFQDQGIEGNTFIIMQLQKDDHWVTVLTEWEEAEDPKASRMYHLVYDSTQRSKGFKDWVKVTVDWWGEMLEECLKRVGRVEDVKQVMIPVDGPKQTSGSNNCGPMAFEFAQQAFKHPGNVTLARRQNRLETWMQFLDYGTPTRPEKGKPTWDGGDTSRLRLGNHMRSETDTQREQWHKEHFNTPLPPDLIDEKKGQNKILGAKEVRGIVEENRRRKKEDRPYGKGKGRKDLSDVLSKRVNPALPTGVELRAYEAKYSLLKQDDIKHLARCGHLPANFKTRKGNEVIAKDPEIRKLMRSEAPEVRVEEEIIDLTGLDKNPTFRTPAEVEDRRNREAKAKANKTTKGCGITISNIRQVSPNYIACIKCNPNPKEDEFPTWNELEEHLEIEHGFKDKAVRVVLMGKTKKKEDATAIKPQEKRKVRGNDAEEREEVRRQEPPKKVAKESKTPEEKLRKASGSEGPAQSPKTKTRRVSEVIDDWNMENKKDRNYSNRKGGGAWNLKRMTRSLTTNRVSAPEQRETMSERGHEDGAQRHKTTREMMGEVPSKKNNYWAHMVYKSFENGKLPDGSTENTRAGLIIIKGAGIVAQEMRSNNVKQKGRAFVVCGQEGMKGLLDQNEVDTVEIVRVEMGGGNIPWKMTPETIAAAGEVRDAIREGEGMYMAGKVKVDCPGPELCNQKKCKTGEQLMTMYVFGFEADGMAGARTLLMAMRPLATMSEGERVEYERNVRGLIMVGDRAAGGYEDLAKRMSKAKLEEVEKEETDERATFYTQREIDEISARRELAAIKAWETLGGDEVQEDVILVDREHKLEAVVVSGMTKAAVMEALRSTGAIELQEGHMTRAPKEKIIGVQSMTEYMGKMEEDTGSVTKVVMGTVRWEDLRNVRREHCLGNIKGKVMKFKVEIKDGDKDEVVGVSDREKVGYYRPQKGPNTTHEEIERGERRRPETHYTDEERGGIYRTLLQETGLEAPGWSRKNGKRCRSKKTCCGLTCEEIKSEGRVEKCGPCKLRVRGEGGDSRNQGCIWRPPCEEETPGAYVVYEHLTGVKKYTNDEAIDILDMGIKGFVKADPKKSKDIAIKKSALTKIEKQDEEKEDGAQEWKHEGINEEADGIVTQVHKHLKRRVSYLRRQKKKDEIGELGIPETHVEEVEMTMAEIAAREREGGQKKATAMEPERGRTLLRSGSKRARIGNPSKSKDRGKKRSESPVRIKSKTGMFSEVEDNISIPGAKENITIVEEAADEECGETLEEGVDGGTKAQDRMDFTSVEQDYEDDEDYEWEEPRIVMEGDPTTHKAVEDVEKALREWAQKNDKQDSKSESDSEDDTVGDEESGEDTGNTSSSEEDEKMEDDSQEGGDQEDDESGDGGAPGGVNL